MISVNKNVYAIVLAAGSSLRMTGTSVPKQFMLIDDHPVLYHTLKAFFDTDLITHLIVVVKPEYNDLTAKICRELWRVFPHRKNFLKVILVPGGEDRNGSILSAYVAIHSSYKPDAKAVVLTHDAARPFVTKELLKKCIEVTTSKGACSVIYNTDDTIALVDKDEFTKTLDRTKTKIVQTPQCFWFKYGLNMFDLGKNNSWPKTTDLSSLLTKIGVKVMAVEGFRDNLKITNNTDLKLARVILSNRAKNKNFS
ncbi:IspD/TarI family cytidylyltransferase [[Mycoplasma] testudinis]|uniref:IspD/TarI family cytidylyltransferase n=1 Tax=[Mycoplasma] testudinis TaxID=33924 RepID=UPI0004837DAA|nr:IspD/TarI family cytidylyltransferase [[Mycoplasma] testudinis]